MRTRVIRKLLATASAVALALTAGAASANEPNFPSREVRFIVPVAPGGAIDTSARLLSEYWEKHLGGKMFVENIAGAEYNNAIFSMLKSKPDGHTVVIFPGVIANQLLGKANYDFREFSWLGRISQSFQVGIASPKSGIRSLGDLQRRDIVKASVTGLSSSQTIGQLLSAKEMGFKVRPIMHKGATPMILSVIRGDADWSTAADITIFPYIQNGDVVPLWVASEKRLPQLPDTPTLHELGYPEVAKIVGFHRIVATNPDTPQEIVDVLRKSFKAAVEDPDFVREYAKLGDLPSYLSGDETAKLVEEQLNLFAKSVEYLQSFK